MLPVRAARQLTVQLTPCARNRQRYGAKKIWPKKSVPRL